MHDEHLRHERAMRACADHCLGCYAACVQTLTQHCLQMGGGHVAPDHVRLMQSCAELCRASAAMMLIGSRYHDRLCTLCAEICTECADDCERLGDMDACVTACRICADSCREMAA